MQLRKQLDGLRFFAFLFVFLHHFGSFPIVVGVSGVNLFLVLSGFLITRIIVVSETGSLKHDLAIFYARRTIRIFPLYYATLLLLLPTGMLPYPLWHFTYLWNVKLYMLGNGCRSMVTHFWSLCLEEQFYLTFPPLFLLTKKQFRPHIIGALLVIAIITRLLFGCFKPDAQYDMLLPVRGQYLLWGCLAGYLELGLNAKYGRGIRVFLSGLLLNLVWLCFALARVPMFGLSETFSGICMALLIFGLWRTTNKSVLAFFTFLPFAYLGKISYALYLFHYFSMPISLILHALSGGTIPGNNAFLRFAITVAMATISWYGFELPVLRLKRFFPYGRANQAVNVSALS